MTDEQLIEKIDIAFENEVKIVRAVCHNFAGEVLQGDKLQDTVIFHLKNFKSNLTTSIVEKPKLVLPEGVPSEFIDFVSAMAKEYNKHRVEKGDLWKTTGTEQLWVNLYWDMHSKRVVNFQTAIQNPTHLLDIANFSWFLWYRLKEEEKNAGS